MATETAWKILLDVEREVLATERKAMGERIRDLEAKVLARSPGEYRALLPPRPHSFPKGKSLPLTKTDPVFGAVPVRPLFPDRENGGKV